jgi:hypothetical protein
MASSSSSAIRTLLEDYVGGRVPADRVVPAVAAQYYRSGTPGGAGREGLRPLMDVIERAAPGVVQLARVPEGPGFDIRLAERPFPPEYEAELRRAVQSVLEVGAAWAGETGRESTTAGVGFWSRLMGRVRRLFSATT